VPRSKRILAVVLVAALFGSSFAWAIALLVVPTGAYEIALQNGEGRLEITLDRRAPADRERHDGESGEFDGLHDEHVVTLTTVDACSTTDPGSFAKVCGPAVLVTTTLDVPHAAAPMTGATRPRAGSSVPSSSFTVLRI
jgi:hypothetical protein